MTKENKMKKKRLPNVTFARRNMSAFRSIDSSDFNFVMEMQLSSSPHVLSLLSVGIVENSTLHKAIDLSASLDDSDPFSIDLQRNP